MRHVVDRNVVMRCMTVLIMRNLFQSFILIHSRCVRFTNEVLQTQQQDLIFIIIPYILVSANYTKKLIARALIFLKIL